MSSQQRAAEAATVAPYLTHAITHHGQTTLVPPDNAGRVRKPPKKRRARNAGEHGDEEMRFNTGVPRSLRSPASSAAINRGRTSKQQKPPRQDRVDRQSEERLVSGPSQGDRAVVNEDDIIIPDYPPPSFDEAISTPPPSLASYCPSPVTNNQQLQHQPSMQFSSLSISQETLGNNRLSVSTVPTSPSSTVPNVSSSPPSSPLLRQASPSPPQRASSDSDSDLSLEIIEPEPVSRPYQAQWEADRRRGLDIQERAKRDRERRFALETNHPLHVRLLSPYPNTPTSPTTSTASTVAAPDTLVLSEIHARRKGPGILIDSALEDDDGTTVAPVPSPTLTHRRKLSLSPIKVFSKHHGNLASPSSSTFSLPLSKSAPFLRSTTSLARPTVSPIRNDSLIPRRFLGKGKDKEQAQDSEPLSSWEVVDSDSPVPEPSSPPPAPRRKRRDSSTVTPFTSSRPSMPTTTAGSSGSQAPLCDVKVPLPASPDRHTFQATPSPYSSSPLARPPAPYQSAGRAPPGKRPPPPVPPPPKKVDKAPPPIPPFPSKATRLMPHEIPLPPTPSESMVSTSTLQPDPAASEIHLNSYRVSLASSLSTFAANPEGDERSTLYSVSSLHFSSRSSSPSSDAATLNVATEIRGPTSPIFSSSGGPSSARAVASSSTHTAIPPRTGTPVAQAHPLTRQSASSPPISPVRHHYPGRPLPVHPAGPRPVPATSSSTPCSPVEAGFIESERFEWPAPIPRPQRAPWKTNSEDRVTHGVTTADLIDLRDSREIEALNISLPPSDPSPAPSVTESAQSSPYASPLSSPVEGSESMTEVGDGESTVTGYLRPPSPAPTTMSYTSSGSSFTLAQPSHAADVLFDIPSFEDNGNESSNSRTNAAEYTDYTDLDVLVSRLEDRNVSGANYDTLVLLSEIIGPALPPSGRSQGTVSTSLVGRIELERRRVTRDGRVKLKLSLLGLAVDRCGICLTQFKEGESASLGSQCRHAFHEKCLRSWLARSNTCPLCRLRIDVDGL